MYRRQLMGALCLGAAALAGQPALAAEAWPNRPLRLIVPYTPGGASDAAARMLAAGMSEKLGQAIVVDNRGGGGTIIATQAVAKSPADGYTILWMPSQFAINDTLYKQVPYRFGDFSMVVDVLSVPNVFIVNPASPARTMADLVKEAKQAPGRLSFGSPGTGSISHLAVEMFQTTAGVKLNHIPYKGSAPAVMDLVAGQTNLVADTVFLCQPQVAAGKVRALAQTGTQRSKLMPDVPTMQEAGFPGYAAVSWMSLAVPAGTPAEIVARLNKAANEVLTSSAVHAAFDKQGLDVMGGSPEESSRRIQGELKRWGEAVRLSGARAD